MRRIVATILFLSVSTALADAGESSSKLKDRYESGRVEGKGKLVSLEGSPEAPKLSAEVTPAPQKPAEPNTAEIVDNLVKKVEELKSKEIVTRQVYLNTESPRRNTATVGTKAVYAYEEGKIYEVNAGVNRITDISLQSGETLTNNPISGDTTRWKIAVVESGTGAKKSSHVIVKPLEENLETNLILVSDRRTYHLALKSSNWYQPAVSWTYPVEEEIGKARQIEEPVATGIAPDTLDFAYRIDGSKVSWKPLRVFNDGSKTYIQMSPDMSNSEAPALFVINEDDEPELTNYRVKGKFYVVDAIIKQAELRVGKSKRVAIVHDSVERSFWERIL